MYKKKVPIIYKIKLTILCFCEFLFNYQIFAEGLKRESEINYATTILSDQNIDFFDRDLRWDSFEETIFLKINFELSRLQNANFRKARLWKANFKKADLTKASFENSWLIGVDFRGANLKQVDFRGAILRGVDFTGAQLQGAILSPTCRLPQYTNIDKIVSIYSKASSEDKEILESIFNFRESG